MREAHDNPLHTPLCETLGIEHPVLQSGMGTAAGPDLVAEVCRAGALGILGSMGVPPADLRRNVRRVRERTDRPFGVNQWLHPAILPPADPAEIPAERIVAVQQALNVFRRRLGLAEARGAPARYPDTAEEIFELVLEERVPVWSIGLGDPGRERVRRCHERGIRVIAMACTVEDARALAASGVDAIVAQGAEAGGHRSTWVKPASVQQAAIGTLALVPLVVDAVAVPVIAAGGIADGRGLVAAFALGAQAVLLGTRFVATRESSAAEFWKDAVLEASADGTVVSDAYTGLYARLLSNRFLVEHAGAPTLAGMLQGTAVADIVEHALARGDREHYPLYAGQSAGLVDDLPGAFDVVREMVAQAREVLGRLGSGSR